MQKELDTLAAGVLTTGIVTSVLLPNRNTRAIITALNGKYHEWFPNIYWQAIVTDSFRTYEGYNRA